MEAVVLSTRSCSSSAMAIIVFAVGYDVVVIEYALDFDRFIGHKVGRR